MLQIIEYGYYLIALAVKVILLVSLSLLPGSWLTFGLPLDNLNIKTRLALGVALSPGMLALQFLILRFLRLGFSYTAVTILIINLPVIILLARNSKLFYLPRLSKTLIYGSMLFILLVGIISLPWILIPNYRPFNWHALLHTDIIYGLTRNSNFLPEEPELAGLMLSYTWTGEVFWSILGWLSNWSPTSIYPITNIVWLFVAFILAYELAKEGFKLPSSTALLSVGLLFTGSGIIGTVAWLIAEDPNRWDWDGRLMDAFIGKYRGFEVILFAYAVLIGLALLSTLAMQHKIRFVGIVISCLLITLGLLYPILFPVGCLFVGGLIFLLITKWAVGFPDYKNNELALMIISFGVSIVVFLVFLMLTTQDRSGTVFQFVQSGRKAKALQALIALLPFLIISAPFTLMSFRRRYGPTILFTLTVFCLMDLYVLTSVYQLEYKFILVANIALTPLAAATVEPLLDRLSNGRWILILLVPLIFGGLYLTDIFRFYPQGGLKNLKNAPPIIENSFWIELDPHEENAGWINVVREYTPINTMVIARASRIHLGPFLNRSLYFPSDIDGQATSGYSVDNRIYMIEQRGYSENIWQKRYEALSMLYNSDDPAQLTGVMQDLLSLNRPLAILFSIKDSTPALTWLKSETIGFQLYADEKYIVWFTDLPASLPIKFTMVQKRQ